MKRFKYIGLFIGSDLKSRNPEIILNTLILPFLAHKTVPFRDLTVPGHDRSKKIIGTLNGTFTDTGSDTGTLTVNFDIF